MALIFWWMLPIWIIAIIAYWLIRYWLKSGRKKHDADRFLPVAHSHRLTELPEYVMALRRYRRLVNWSVALLSLGLLVAILLSARPSTVSVITPDQQNRDVMLCLDASGSVLREDATLLDRFSSIVGSIPGQRFGLTLFNSSAISVIPLNDDYQLTAQQLQTTAQAFRQQTGTTFTQLTNGTLADFNSGTSLVSDGLVSCMQHLGANPQHRSQSVILGTDDEVNGTPIVGMTQAVAIAKQTDIHIFAIDPGISNPQLAGDHTQLKIITEETGGDYTQLSDPNAINTIVGDIGAQKSDNFVGLPQLATNDDPAPLWYGLVIIVGAALVLIWKLEV